MASPWKFLARLVSPRRLEKQDGSAIEEVKPDVSPMAGPAEAPVKENLKRADQPTREKAQPLVQSGEPERLAKTGSDIQGLVENHSDEDAQTSDPALPDIDSTLAYAAPKVEETAKTAPAKRRGRPKTIKAVAVGSQTSPVVSTISDEMSLDQEISALRDQLASKLRLQNAQLKQMLERFDR